jgi:hypothetical protein
LFLRRLGAISSSNCRLRGVQILQIFRNEPLPQLNLLAALITRLEPKGLYALGIDRQGRTPEIHCAFEKDTDALKLAKAVGASAAGRYPGWASQRTFLLDDATRRGIAAALKGR